MANPLKKIFQNSSPKTKKLTLYTILEVIAVLIMCFVGGCFDWVHLKFTFDKFATWGFYESVLQKWILYSCALLVGTFFKLEKEELNNKDYQYSLLLYRMYLKHKLESFVIFIENIFNPKIKKLYMKQRIENKLLKLDRFAKDEWRIEFNEAIESKNVDGWNWKTEKSKKYALRRIQLTKMLDPQYIENNWKNTDIKYPAISPRVFTNYLRKNITDDQQYRVTNETAKDMGGKISRKLVMVFLISVVLALFIMEPQANELLEQAYGWIVMIIKYIIRVVMITINFFIGLYTGREVFYDNYVLPIENRIRILIEYITWENSIDNSIIDSVKVEFNKEVERIEKEERLKKAKEVSIEMDYEEAKKAGLIKDEQK